MSKYTYRQKLKAVRYVTEDKMSLEEAGKLYGCGGTHIRQWIRLYEEFGKEGLSIKHGTYSGDFKKNAVEYMHEYHLSLREAAGKLGILDHKTLGKWERIYYEEGPDYLYKDNRGRKRTMDLSKLKHLKKLNTQTEQDLITEVQRLRMENEYLKKLHALVQERIARENGKKLPS